MKKTSFFALILCVCLIFSTTAALAVTDTVTKSGTFEGHWGDSFQWALYDDGELVITGEGILTCNPYGVSNGSAYPWYSSYSKVKSITVGEGITAVGLYVFDSCYATSVSLPETLTSIGKYAFRGTKLTSVRTPAKLATVSSYAFLNCNSLATVKMPNVTTIDSNAFENCKALKEITIAAKYIYSEAFYNCNTLHTVNFSVVPTTLNTTAFTLCSKLKTVNFVGSATQWSRLTSGNTVLTNATVNYATALSFDANGGGFGISPVLAVSGSEVTIPATLPIRKGYTFRGWATYKYDTVIAYQPGDTLTLSANTTLYAVWETPEGVIAKGTHPNTDMSWILYDDGHLVISGTGSVYGDNSSDTEGYKHYRTKIKTVTVNEGITGIGNEAFYNFPITSISLPSTLTGIGNNAFSYTSLQSISIPANVTSIGNGMLLGSKIETIHLGNPINSVSSIFTNCTDMYYLTNITVDENNALYTVVDGVLYNKDMTVLIRVPATYEGQFVVPDTVTGISQYAFSDTANLESLVLPVSLASIGDRVFNSDVSPIIYYKGTEEQWQNVTIGTVWNNIVPTEYEYGKIYTISYNANGGNFAPVNSEKVKGEAYTLPEAVPTKSGYNFLGWATTQNATEATYQPGDTYTENQDTVFYAVWDLKEPEVTVSSFRNLWMFTVTLSEHQDNLTAYAVLYNSEHTLLACDCYPIENASSDLMLTADGNAAYAKVFVLDDTSISPYTKSVTVPLN